MKILLFGASGMVGQGVLRAALRDPAVARVVTIGRGPSGNAQAKLHETVLADLFDIAALAPDLFDCDACFFCLGVSVAGLSAADYTRITHDLTLTIAARVAALSPQATFVYVSGAGTRVDSRMMWARVKGRTEAALSALPFQATYLFRPGIIQPLHGIASKTGWYRALYAVAAPLARPVGALFPGAIVTTEQVGQAMLAVAAHGYPTAVLGNRDIAAAAASRFRNESRT